MAGAVVTVAAGAIGLIVGWFVSGTQRVTEKLTEERRSSYLAFLHAADEANDYPQANRKVLERAAEDAEFICPDQMLNSGRIKKLLAAVDTGTWKDERQHLLWLHAMKVKGIHIGDDAEGCLNITEW